MKRVYLYRSDVWCRGSTAMLILSLLAIMGCSQKDLVMPSVDTDVDIVFDWNDCRNAEVEGMTLYFYPDGPLTQLWRFDLSGREGGKIRIPTGRYNVLAVNNDLKNVEYRHTDNFDLFSAKACYLSGDTLTAATGMLYGATLSALSIGEESVSFFKQGSRKSKSNEKIITLTPDSLCTSYHIRVDSVSGVERVRTVKAILSGVAESVNVLQCQNSPVACSTVIPMNIDNDSSGCLIGAGCAFGTPDIANPVFHLTILVQTSHAIYSKSFDITRQVVNSKWQRDVYIVIKGMNIPSSDSPEESGVGINVGVDGWQTIEITYS